MALDSSSPRHRRLTRFVVLAATVVLASPFVDVGAAQATVEGQRAEVERIVDELDRLGEQADILAEDYAVAVDDKNQLDIEIVKAEERLAEKEAELSRLRGDLAQVAVRAYTGAGTDVLGPLFSDAAAYSDGLQRDQYSRVALDVGTGTTDDLDELIGEIDDERSDLEDKRDQAAELAEQIASKQQQVQELTEQYVAARSDAERRLGELIAEEEARRSAAALAELQRQAAAANTGGGGGGGGGTDNGGGGGDQGGGGGGDQGGGGGGDQGGGGNDSGGGDQGGGGNDSGGGDSGGSGGGGGGGGGGYVPPVSGLAGVAIEAAMGQLGVAYRYATSNPGVSFDCSGLTHYAWAQAGIYLPRNSRAQAAATSRVPSANAQPGDLIFYYSPISHVGIYLGGGQLVHAPNSGTVVKVANVNWSKVTAVGRPG
jgi:peptidoglycan DL-endopeptidase CwlO